MIEFGDKYGALKFQQASPEEQMAHEVLWT